MHPGAMKIGHWKLVNNLLRFIEALWRRKGITPIRRPEKLFPDKVTAATTSCFWKFNSGASWSIFRLGFTWSAVSECGVRDCFFFSVGGVTLKWSLLFFSLCRCMVRRVYKWFPNLCQFLARNIYLYNLICHSSETFAKLAAFFHSIPPVVWTFWQMSIQFYLWRSLLKFLKSPSSSWDLRSSSSSKFVRSSSSSKFVKSSSSSSEVRQIRRRPGWGS